jgi:hypothetical protein
MSVLEWGDITLNVKIDQEDMPDLYQYLLDHRFDPNLGKRVIIWILQGIERDRERGKWHNDQNLVDLVNAKAIEGIPDEEGLDEYFHDLYAPHSDHKPPFPEKSADDHADGVKLQRHWDQAWDEAAMNGELFWTTDENGDPLLVDRDDNPVKHYPPGEIKQLPIKKKTPIELGIEEMEAIRKTGHPNPEEFLRRLNESGAVIEEEPIKKKTVGKPLPDDLKSKLKGKIE